MPHVHVQDNFKIQKKLTVTPSLGIFNDDQYNFELVLNSIRMAMTRIHSFVVFSMENDYYRLFLKLISNHLDSQRSNQLP